MRRNAVALMAGLLLGLSCQSIAVADDLFPDNLFPEDKGKPLFPAFTFDAPTVQSSKQQDPAAQKKVFKERIGRADEQMRQQMQKVAGWLQEFSLRNQHRFPGEYGSSGTISRAAEVQLTELAGGNPYAGAYTGVESQELNALSPPLAYYYNNNGTPVDNSPAANDEWTAELTAENAHRIHLQMDGSASPGEVDSMRNDPPSSMQAVPGMITACGNGQGYLYVWGAGIDGKPLKDYDGKLYIITAQTSTTVEDQGQAANY